MRNRLTKTLTLSVSIICLSLAGCLEKSSSDSNSSGPGTPGNNALPTISGNPSAAVTVGDSYSFTPSATDADGDPLTFTIENKPSWAIFESTSGHLSGVPSLADIGTYSNILISVSDGTASASLPTFAVDVTQVGTVSTTLNWTPPTLNEDGSTLTDLAGYVIFYGTSTGNYTTEIRIDNPSITTYVVENLSPNTYYFASKSFNTAEVMSGFSGEAVRTLQ